MKSYLKLIEIVPNSLLKAWTTTFPSILWSLQLTCFLKDKLVIVIFRTALHSNTFFWHVQQTCRLIKTRSPVCDLIIVETLPLPMILPHYHWTTVAPAPFQQLKAALKSNWISFLLLLKNTLFQQNSVNWKIQQRIIIESMEYKHFTKKLFFSRETCAGTFTLL